MRGILLTLMGIWRNKWLMYAILAVSIVVVSWGTYTYFLKNKVSLLTEAVGSLTTTVEEQNLDNIQLRKDIVELDRLLEERRRSFEDISEDERAQIDTLEELKSNDPEVKIYLESIADSPATFDEWLFRWEDSGEGN